MSRSVPPFVIPGRSKERSDAAQTLGSMPLQWSNNAAMQWLLTAGEYHRMNGIVGASGRRTALQKKIHSACGRSPRCLSLECRVDKA
ncbi:MAG: hypothetical protein E5W70_27575 [Mesorhizobium sp.]|nr:MAG: hypothetical protein E5W70_27575 [Mesorhizobium sp.]